MRWCFCRIHLFEDDDRKPPRLRTGGLWISLALVKRPPFCCKRLSRMMSGSLSPCRYPKRHSAFGKPII